MGIESRVLPESMAAELAAWNNGKGIDLESWIGCVGNFKLAIGYSAVFWPGFVLCEDYILRNDVSAESIRKWEVACNYDKRSVECVLNHVHIADMHNANDDVSEDKIVFLGNILKQIWQAKLNWQFPDRPCEVSFYEPENRKDLTLFELSFWQKKHERR